MKEIIVLLSHNSPSSMKLTANTEFLSYANKITKNIPFKIVYITSDDTKYSILSCPSVKIERIPCMIVIDEQKNIQSFEGLNNINLFLQSLLCVKSVDEFPYKDIYKGVIFYCTCEEFKCNDNKLGDDFGVVIAESCNLPYCENSYTLKLGSKSAQELAKVVVEDKHSKWLVVGNNKKPLEVVQCLYMFFKEDKLISEIEDELGTKIEKITPSVTKILGRSEEL